MGKSYFLEIPKLDNRFPFRSFPDYGHVFVYPHWHKEIEIIYVVKGLVKIGVEDELVDLQEGEIYFFDTGVPHYFFASPESKRLVYQFDTSLYSQLFLDAEYGETIQEVFFNRENWSRNWPASVQSEMQQVLMQIYEANEAIKQNNLATIYLFLHQLLWLFYEQVPKKKNPTRQIVKSDALRDHSTIDKLEKVFLYLENNYQEKITLENIAQEIGFNPQYFSRFFKKHTGITFVEFLTEYRINMAKAILSAEAIPMIEVAEKAGFNSVKTFHHVFKEYVGMSPKKYQMSISGN